MIIFPVTSVALSAIAVFLVARQIRLAGGLSVSGYVVLALCIAPTLTIMLAALAGSRFVVPDGEGGVTFVSQENWQISNAAKLVVLVIAIVLAFITVTRNGLQSPGLLFVAGAALTAMFGSAFAGYAFFDARISTMAAMLFAFAFIRGGRRLDLGVSLFAVSLVFLSSLLWLFDPALATLECRSYKCGPLGMVVVGVFNNENQLALPLALSLVFISRALTGRTRLYVWGVLLLFVYASGSRTSAIAMAIYVVIALVVLTRRTSRMTMSFVWLAAATSLAVALLIPLLNEDPVFLTGRGRLWDAALTLVSSSPLTGVGIYPWRDLVANGAVATNAGATPSNLWMDVLMVGGFLGASLCLVGFSVTYFRSTPRDRLHLALACVLIGCVGIAESTFVFADLSSPYAYFVPALLAGRALTRKELKDSKSVFFGTSDRMFKARLTTR